MAASKPINQMRVGQDLEQALVAPATGAERAAVFGNKVRQAENTVSKGSGNPRIQDLTPAQRKIVDAIEEDFLRNQQFKELAIAGKQGMEERIGAPTLPPTGFFQPVISAARSWVNKGLGTGHQQALKRAAEVMDNPQEMAEAISKILNDTELKKKFSRESLKISKEHSLESTLDKYEKIYSDLVEAR